MSPIRFPGVVSQFSSRAVSAHNLGLQNLILPMLVICISLISAMAQNPTTGRSGRIANNESSIIYETKDISRLDYVPDEILVKLRAQIPAELLGNGRKTLSLELPIDSLFAKYSIRQAEPLFHEPQSSGMSLEANRIAQTAFQKAGLGFIYRLRLPSRTNVIEAANAFRRNPDVEYAEPNYIYHASALPDDPYLASEGSWGQPYKDLWGLYKISAPDAWNLATGQGVTTAVVDTGCDISHPDLASNVWVNKNEIPGNGIDDDRNGFVDDVYGWNFDRNNNNVEDQYGHGSHVAGTIAAAGNNNQGIIGVAWQSKVMCVKGLSDNGSGYSALLAVAVSYAAQSGASIINMSWGGNEFSQVLEDALQFASDLNVVLVAAAGNEYGNAADNFPGASRYVINVGSSDHNDSKSDFSNYGIAMDVLAPGGDNWSSASENLAYENILSLLSSTATGNAFDARQIVGQNYLRARGTSMAAPHVSGLAALILERFPDVTPEEVRQVLRHSADPLIAGGWSEKTGYGRINALKALGTTTLATARIYEPRYGIFRNDAIPLTLFADARDFREYRIEYQPSGSDSWTTIVTSSIPAMMAKLPDWDVESVPDSDYLLRLRTISNSGEEFEDRQEITLDRVEISAPPFNEAHRPGDSIPIAGVAGGAGFVRYEILIKNKDSGQVIPANVALENGGAQKVYNGLLATWDTSSIQEAGFYEIQLIAKRENLPDITETTQVLIDATLHPGWPRSTLQPDGSGWYYAFMGNITAADLLKDGRKEILVGYGNEVRIYRSDGSQLPGWPQRTSTLQFSPAVGDLDGDGFPEIAAVTLAGAVYVWNRMGSLLPGWPVWVGNGSTMQVVIADVDANRRPELIVYNSYGYITIMNEKAKTLSGWPLASSNLRIWDPISVADLDSDGQKELIFTGEDSDSITKVFVLGSNGAPKPGWPYAITPRKWYLPYPVVADFNGDGKPEIATHDSDHTLFMLRADGTLLPGWPKTYPLAFITSLAAGDINGDSMPELIAGGPSDSGDVVYALDAVGNVLPGWPVSASMDAWMLNGVGLPAIADIDGDGRREVIISGKGAYPTYYPLFAYRGDGTGVPGFPKPARQSGFTYAGPAVLDFDGDGLLEIAWMDGHGDIYMWDLPSPAIRDDLSWPMYQHDPGKTGANFIKYKSTSEELSLASSGSLSFVIPGTDTVRAGSAIAQITGSAPYGTAVFSLKQNGITVSEAGVPANSLVISARVFIENREYASPGSAEKDLATYTGIAIANPGDTPVTVTYTLRDSYGYPLAMGNGTIQAHGHRARFISQFGDADMAPDFQFPVSFTDSIQYGTLEINSSQPVSVLGLRLTYNQHDNALMSTTPVVNQMLPPQSNKVYIPRIVFGSGWGTTVLLMNTSNLAESGTLHFLDASGSPLQVVPKGGNSGSSFPYSIPAHGAMIMELDPSGPSTRDGWLKVEPDSLNISPSAFGILSYTQNGILVTQTGIPSVLATNHARIYVDLSYGHSTGLAIANPVGALLSFSAAAYQSDGVTPAGTVRGPFTIAGNGETAAFTDTFVSGLSPGFTGVLDISSNGGTFVPLTLRTLNNERNEFLISLFPVADLARTAPSTVLFPQIAAGGYEDQYTTEVIFLGAGSASVVLKYLSDDGSPLQIAH